jgi:hypothetical protein
MARDLLEESVRGLPRGMARFPHIPADRKRPVFPLGTSRVVSRLEFFAD